MKVQVLWGFEGDPEKLKTETGRVAAGTTLDIEDEEYAHALIGKGLAAQVGTGSSPAENKLAAAAEKKALAEKAAAEKKAAADKAQAEKEATEKAEAERVAAEQKAAADKAAAEAK